MSRRIPRRRVDVLGSPFYASSDSRAWGAISLKDIENYKLLRVQESLQRLDLALSSLESVADKVDAQVKAATGTVGTAAAEAAAIQEKLDRLTQDHGTLKETANRVATRLDQAIGRLSATLQD